MYVYESSASLVSEEIRRGPWVTWNWSYRWLAVSHHMVLETKLMCFARTSALNFWAIFSAPIFIVFKWCVCLHMNGGTLGGWKRESDSLLLELQVVWVLGIRPRHFARIVYLTHQLCLLKFSLKSRWLPSNNGLLESCLKSGFVVVVVVIYFLVFPSQGFSV